MVPPELGLRAKSGGGTALVRRWYYLSSVSEQFQAVVPPSYGGSTAETPKNWEMTLFCPKFKPVGAYINPTLSSMKGHRKLAFI